MKIVDLKTFLSYPSGVVFAEYHPCVVGEIEIRGGADIREDLRCSHYTRFSLCDTEDTMLFEPGDESPVVMDEYSRTGPGLDVNQLYVVFDKKDIATMIERLQRAHQESKE